MTELEKINGKPFKFFGFDWDYSGSVFFEQGNLADKKVHVSLGVKEGNYEDKEYLKMVGDVEIMSDSKIAKKFDPYVVEISMRTKN